MSSHLYSRSHVCAGRTGRGRETGGRTSDWRDQASCLTEGPELFFPIGSTGPSLVQTEDAKQVCAGCPVRSACLRWALDMGMTDGVWGGLSPAERRSVNRSNRQHRLAPAFRKLTNVPERKDPAG